MKAMLTAAVFLTRVPIPLDDVIAEDVSRSARWFPLIGALLGVATAALALALTYIPQLPPTMAALVLVTTGAWVTGAIHLDGLADSADGFGGGRTPDDVLRIMRDPRLGSFGVLALIFVIATKIGAIATLWERNVLFPFLISVPALSRWTAVALGVWLSYARAEGGVGKAVVRRGDIRSLALASGIAVAVAWGALGAVALVQASIAVAVTLGIGTMARRRIGGVTGDVFGACIELTETALLVSGVVMTDRT